MPAGFKKLAASENYFEVGALKFSVKAGETIDWIKESLGLALAHSLNVLCSVRGRVD